LIQINYRNYFVVFPPLICGRMPQPVAGIGGFRTFQWSRENWARADG
jgi:hypothetical protein